MKKILLLTLILFPVFASAQKREVTFANDKVYVNDSFYCRIEREGCGFGSTKCTYTIMGRQHKRVLIIKPGKHYDISGPSRANPDGTVPHLEFIFLESGEKVIVRDFFAIKSEKIGRFIVKNELFKNGDIDVVALRNFITIYQ